MPVLLSQNSTNVRPYSQSAATPPPLPEDASRTIGLAVGVWGSAVALGVAEGVFERLGIEVQIALAVFAVAFAMATYGLDAGIRRAIDGVPLRALVLAGSGVDGALLVAFGAAGTASLAAGPVALLTLFAAPLAGVAHVAAVRGLARARLSSPAAKSPGARPAAT